MSIVQNTKMTYNTDWIIPKLRSASKLLNISGTILMGFGGLFTRFLIVWLNRSKIYNQHIIDSAIVDRPKDVPLITVSNHHSCFDDPGIWGTLKLSLLLNRSIMRWTLSAKDICYTCALHAYFFTLGKGIPVIRGKGVYQEAVDFCIELLNKGEWVHVFPEGKINMTKEDIPLKWGIGRLISESSVNPIVIPIWHIGMDELLPNTWPYVYRVGKKLTFNYGKPIDFAEMLGRLRARKATAAEVHKEITDRIEIELLKLKRETEILHQSR